MLGRHCLRQFETSLLRWLSSMFIRGLKRGCGYGNPSVEVQITTVLRGGLVERVKGLEPSIFSLGSRRVTAVLHLNRTHRYRMSTAWWWQNERDQEAHHRDDYPLLRGVDGPDVNRHANEKVHYWHS
jgi:hypothetical protein